MNPILLIPARMASTRLPDKPLADIGGVPMIVRVWARAVAAGLGPVVVAAGEPEIVAAVQKAGGQAVLTDPDLPALDPDQLKKVVMALEKTGADIATLAAPIDNEADAINSAVVKAVVAWD